MIDPKLGINIINHLQSKTLEFIKSADKHLSITNNIQDVAISYAIFIHQMIDDIRTNVGLLEAQSYAKSNQYDFISLFGIEDKFQPIHQHIKSPKLFWALFGLSIKNTEFPSINFEMLKDSYEIESRKNLTLNARSYAYISFQSVFKRVDEFLVLIRKQSLNVSESEWKRIIRLIIKEAQREINDCIKKNITTLNRQKTYTLYRGIDIDKSKNIRVGRYKVGNPLSQTQDWGRGFSFTNKKEVATRFALHKFVDDESSLGISKDRRFDNLSFLFNEIKVSKDNFLNDKNKRPYVIKFKVDYESILIDASGLYENELIVDPESAKVISYLLPKY